MANIEDQVLSGAANVADAMINTVDKTAEAISDASLYADKVINGVGETEGVYIGHASTGSTSFAEAAASNIYNQIAESDYEQGRSELKKEAGLFGVSSNNLSSSIAGKDALANHMSNRYKGVNAGEYAFIGSGFSTDNVKAMSSLAQYKNNMNALNKYFEKRGVNAKNLDYREIGKSLRSGQIKSSYHYGKDIRLDDNMTKALRELQFYKSKQVKDAVADASKKSSLVKNLATEAYKDSDAYKGYQIAKIAGKGAIVGAKVSVYGVGGGLNAGSYLAQGVQHAHLNTQKIIYKNDAAKLSEINTKKQLINQNSAASRQKINEAISKAASPVNTASGLVKNKASDSFKKLTAPLAERLAKNIVFKRFSKINGIVGKGVVKIIKIPGAIMNFVNDLKKQLLISIGIFLFIIFAVAGVVMWFSRILAPTSQESESGKVEDSNAQKLIDYLYDYQEAYEENLYNCVAGSEFASYGIPSTWRLTDTEDRDSTNAIENNMTAVYDSYGNLLGYNLNHYYGPADREYTQSVWYEWQEEETKTVTTVNDDGTEDTEEVTETVWKGEWRTMTLKGVGGLEGDLGNYTTLNGTIDENSAAYTDLRSKENPYVTVNFHYRGSQYSYSYSYGKYSSYIGQSGEETTYDLTPLYKGFLAMAISFSVNQNENIEFLEAYIKPIFDQVMQNARVTVTTTFQQNLLKSNTWTYTSDKGTVTRCFNPGYDAYVDLNVYFNECGLADMISFDTADDTWAHSNGSTGIYAVSNTSDAGYKRWDGWFNADGTISDSYNYALIYYELDDEAWDLLFTGITFPGNLADKLSSGEIEDIIEQVRENNGGELSAARENMIRFALQSVGRFYYKYGSGHPISNLSSPPGGLDCSGFVSYALYEGGADLLYSARGAITLASNYTGVSFGGNYGLLQPGTIIVKNAEAGTAITSSNHVVIFIGYAKLDDDTVARPIVVECTTFTTSEGRKISGTQISDPSRVSGAIAGYLYARDPF